MGKIYDLGNQGQVIPTKTSSLLPLLTVLIQAAYGKVMPGTIIGFVLPNGSLDSSQADLMSGFLLRRYFKTVID
jgi:hypothetical protein